MASSSFHIHSKATTSSSFDIHSKATAYASLAEASAFNSGSGTSEISGDSGLLSVLPVSAESAGLLPKRKGEILIVIYFGQVKPVTQIILYALHVAFFVLLVI